MKNIVKTFAILFLSVTYSCNAQQLVETPNDAYKLKINEQQFINKTLNNLLKEIKPEIKFAYATTEYPSFFSFRFISSEEQKQHKIGRKLIGLYVYVKEPLDWKFEQRPKGKEYQWTKEDLEKYGNLTVIRIKVIERIED
jgi:hypothetical protein